MKDLADALKTQQALYRVKQDPTPRGFCYQRGMFTVHSLPPTNLGRKVESKTKQSSLAGSEEDTSSTLSRRPVLSLSSEERKVLCALLQLASDVELQESVMNDSDLRNKCRPRTLHVCMWEWGVESNVSKKEI